MGDSVFPVLATIILVATLITLIVAVASYILFRIKEKRRAMEAAETAGEVSSETPSSAELPFRGRRKSDLLIGATHGRRMTDVEGNADGSRGSNVGTERRGGGRSGDGAGTRRSDELSERRGEPVQSEQMGLRADSDSRIDERRRQADEIIVEDDRRRSRGDYAGIAEEHFSQKSDGSQPRRQQVEHVEEPAEDEELAELSSAQAAFLRFFKSTGATSDLNRKPGGGQPITAAEKLKFRQFSGAPDRRETRDKRGPDEAPKWK